jgi:hypothetical protein
MYLTKIEKKHIDCMHQRHNKDSLRSVVNTIMNLQFPPPPKWVICLSEQLILIKDCYTDIYKTGLNIRLT